MGHQARQVLETLERDWRAMCGNQNYALQSRLNPLEMTLALPYAFVLGREAPGQGKMRVAGRSLHELIGSDPRGRDLSSLFTDGDQETAGELIEAAFTLPAVVEIPLQLKRRFVRKPMYGALILLPMHGASGSINRLLGAVSFGGNPTGISLSMNHDISIRCDMQEGNFPDRRMLRRPKKAAPDLRLVVDNA